MKAKMILCNFIACIMVIASAYGLIVANIDPDKAPGLYISGLSLIAAFVYHYIGKYSRY